VKGVSVRLAQSDLARLEAVQRMLLRLGIVSTIYAGRRSAGTKLLPDGKGGRKAYPVQTQHELVISGDNLVQFDSQIGFADSKKAAKLSRLLAAYARRLNRERFVARVLSVTLDGEEDVYDVRIPGAHAFDANGFMAHNCGEQPLLPYESCNLGSINLTRFVKDGRMDLARLDETVDLAVHFLDNVIDANRYPIAEIERATLDSRKIGLGVMGFSDCLYMMNIPYDSEEALRLAEELFRRVAERGRAASARMGEKRGSFPLFARSAWKGKGFTALRNATVTTIAPTGTIGLIAGVSSGIEPVFALRYWRTMAEGTTFFETHAEFRRRAEALGADLEALFSGCARDGSIRACKELPEELRRVFVVARDISPEWHVRMQAAFQRFSDNGVSKTINLPRSASVEDVRQSYRLAYELKCKGITVYREGSKEAEVLRAGPPVSALDKIPRLNSESCDPRDSTACLRCPG
jgi:ribonucleoside-diphosphate reductase alpha chain